MKWKQYETLKEAGYDKIFSLGSGEFILQTKYFTYELWFANKNHASYGIKYKNTHLEFASTLK